MNSPIRVMLVDDSSVVRKLLTQALSRHPEIEIVGSASNGVIALHKLPLLQPEVVILDVEMPEMDGITMLQNLRAQYPRLPVIMFSTLTERGAHVTFDALAVGASDYVLKPSTQSGETLDTVVSSYLVPKILGLARSRFGLAVQAAVEAVSVFVPDAAPTQTAPNPFARGPALAAQGPLGKPLAPAAIARPALPGATGAAAALRESPPARVPAPTPVRASAAAVESLFARAQTGTRSLVQGPKTGQTALLGSSKKAVQVIVIAASTGGPNALAEVLPRLPGNLPVPVVIVQHMPPIFTRCLADRLASRSELKVIESEGGERLLPGHVYIAPGNRHLELERDGEGVRTLLTNAPPENSCRPAADVLFRSVVRAYGGAVLGVVLTGMGQDGLRGAREVHEAGGRVLVQSGPTCVIWGMPKAVEEAGIAEAVVPLPEMASAILSRVGLGLSVRSPGEPR